MTVGDGTRAEAGGYRLADVRLPARHRRPGRPDVPDPRPATTSRSPDFTEQQTKLLHLYVVRTDYAVYRHLHPTLAEDGTWAAPVDLDRAG